jgi:endonuclease-3
MLSAAEKAQRVLGVLEKWYGEATTELHYRNAYELAVAVVLSAQCTDVRVNQTTPAFFERFPDFEALAMATPEEVFPYIRSISYPNSKAQRLVALAQAVMKEYGGRLPEDPERLATLPGIGRKSANVLASVLFEAPVIAVDTHVFRVSRRLGLAKGNTPEKVEQELSAIIPPEYLGRAHHWLILFGRYHCTARRPKCGNAPLRSCAIGTRHSFLALARLRFRARGLMGRGERWKRPYWRVLGLGSGALPSAKPKRAAKNGRHSAFEWGSGFGYGGAVDAQKLGGAVCGNYFSVWAAA